MSDSTLELHCDGIASVCSGVTNLKKTFSLAPTKLDTAELPAQYTFTGQSNWSESTLGRDFIDVRRVYRVQVAVLPTGQGTPQQRESECQPLIDLVTRELSKYPSLKGIEGVQNSRVLGDSGIVVLPEWGAKFIGFEVRFEVNYILHREFGPGE